MNRYTFRVLLYNYTKSCWDAKAGVTADTEEEARRMVIDRARSTGFWVRSIELLRVKTL